jgi:hypothetical protein
MGRTASVIRSDERDTEKKHAFIHYHAANTPALATKMAQAIADNVELLEKLAFVVKLLSNHDTARSILEEVFKRPGVAKRYARAHKAFARAQLEQLFAPA